MDLKEMDAMVSHMKELRDFYDEKKAASNEAWHEYQKQVNKIMEAMEENDKTKYVVEGLGTVSVVNKLQYKLPKTLDEKKQVFDYLKGTAPDALMNMLTINHNTFNAYMREEFAAKAEQGEQLEIPGMDGPTHSTEIRFTKKR